jgi:hypothetical protein
MERLLWTRKHIILNYNRKFVDLFTSSSLPLCGSVMTFLQDPYKIFIEHL